MEYGEIEIPEPDPSMSNEAAIAWQSAYEIGYRQAQQDAASRGTKIADTIANQDYIGGFGGIHHNTRKIVREAIKEAFRKTFG